VRDDEPPSGAECASARRRAPVYCWDLRSVLLISTKLQILSVSFRTQRRSDVEPRSGARWRDGEPPDVASLIRRRPRHGEVDADVAREAKLEVWQLDQTIGHNKIVAMMKKGPDVAVLTLRPGVKHMIHCC
jgi:hypothetical protein